MVRFKNRYLLVELIPFSHERSGNGSNRYHSSSHNPDNFQQTTSAPTFSSASVAACVRRNFEANFGISGASAIAQSLSIKYSNTCTNMMIIRVPRDLVSEVWATLTLMSEWPAEGIQSNSTAYKCTWKTVHSAGTIRSCQEAAIKYSKLKLGQINRLDISLEPLKKKIRSIDS